MKTISIQLRLETASHRKRMMGIFRALGAPGSWDVRIVPNEDVLREQLSGHHGKDVPDGIISGIPHSEKTKEAIRTVGVPFVGIGMSEADLGAKLPRSGFVLNDNEGVGRVAARHFLFLGNFRSFAFVPDTKGRQWSVLRGESFRTALKQAGKRCVTYAPGGDDDVGSLAGFLASLPRPAAVFAAWDGRAADVLHTARKAGIRVPADLAVLGVDDDEIICEHTVPTLSSIRTDAEGMGEAAAKILIRLIGGKAKGGAATVRRPVLGITERGSTRTPSPASVLIQRAIAFIDAEAVNGIGPDDVAKHLRVSRRLLDLRFRQYESESVAKRITRRKIEQVKTLLETSLGPVQDIFRRSGFASVASATKLFRSATGQAPNEWRRTHRR